MTQQFMKEAQVEGFILGTLYTSLRLRQGELFSICGRAGFRQDDVETAIASLHNQQLIVFAPCGIVQLRAQESPRSPEPQLPPVPKRKIGHTVEAVEVDKQWYWLSSRVIDGTLTVRIDVIGEVD